MAVQCITEQNVGENCSGFTSWLSLQCGGYSTELQDEKTKSPLFPDASGAERF